MIINDKEKQQVLTFKKQQMFGMFAWNMTETLNWKHLASNSVWL